MDGGGVAGVPMWNEVTAKGRKAVGLGMAKVIRLPTFMSLGMVEVLMSSPLRKEVGSGNADHRSAWDFRLEEECRYEGSLVIMKLRP